MLSTILAKGHTEQKAEKERLALYKNCCPVECSSRLPPPLEDLACLCHPALRSVLMT